ncbi:hypothetical protein D3C80_1754510 [compost metagenome]
MRIGIDKLQRVVTPRLDLRHAQYQRLGAQVGAKLGVGGVRVGRLDRLVVRGIDARGVVQSVPRRLVLGVVRIDEIGVLNPVVVDQWESVDIRIAGDATGFFGCEAGIGVRTAKEEGG